VLELPRITPTSWISVLEPEDLRCDVGRRVFDALYERATGYSYNTVKIFRDKNGNVIKVPYAAAGTTSRRRP
jgi:hypothetical protein